MSTTGKERLVLPIQEQIHILKDADSSLHGGIDENALSKLHSAKARLNGEGRNFYPFVLPKRYALDSSREEQHWLDVLRMSCDKQGIEFADERSENERRLSSAPITPSRNITALCERQEGDFIVFLAQLGQERDSSDWSRIPIIHGEFRLSLFDVAKIFCAQQIERLCKYNRYGWWIGTDYPLERTASASRSEESIPCFKYRRNFSGNDTLSLTSLKELCFFQPEVIHHDHGGFASAIYIE